MYSNVFYNLRVEFGTAEGRRLKPGRVTAVSKAKLVMLHGSGTEPFFKSRATAVLKSHFILWIEFGTAVSQRLKLA